MAEDTPAGQATTEEQLPKSKLPIKAIMLIIGVLALEGGTIGIFMAANKGPKPSEGSNPIEETKETAGAAMAEISLIDSMQVDNYRLGVNTRMIVTVAVTAKVEKEKELEFQPLVEMHRAEIKDRIRALVSSADTQDIQDAELQVIKREIKINVERIVGREDCIDEILITGFSSHVVE